jgi:hypothetical protein
MDRAGAPRGGRSAATGVAGGAGEAVIGLASENLNGRGSAMAHDVFLSYLSKDEAADAVRHALEQSPMRA